MNSNWLVGLAVVVLFLTIGYILVGLRRKKIPNRMREWSHSTFFIFWGGLILGALLWTIGLSRLDQEQKEPYQVLAENAEIPGYKVVVCVDAGTDYTGETVPVEWEGTSGVTSGGDSLELVRFSNPRQYCGVVGYFDADRTTKVTVGSDVEIKHLWLRFESPPVAGKKAEKTDDRLVVQELQPDQDGSYRFKLRTMEVRDKSWYIEIGPGSSWLLPARPTGD